MKKLKFFSQVRAAMNIRDAFNQNRQFAQQDLDVLGLPSDFSERYKK